ncbi:AAA family ATPase [Halorubrum laminariae]|uniref:AAA family ATPase n=1 Tax=Halorubrum laminariae TaxID=1433523 RepID=A0ABD6C0A9_9EURY|nr:AAA family ATPase [Halorubrum laminariae]
MSTTDTTSPDAVPTEEVVAHFANRLIRERGGPISTDDLVYSVENATSISRNTVASLLKDADTSRFETDRDSGGELLITRATTTSPEPAAVTAHFGALNQVTNDLTAIEAVDDDVEALLNDAGYRSFRDLTEADAAALRETLNNDLETDLDAADLSTIPGLTNSDVEALANSGIQTDQELIDASPEQVVEQADRATLTTAKINRAQSALEDASRTFTPGEVNQIVGQAYMNLPVGGELAAEQLQRHHDRVATLGRAGAVVSTVAEETATVGRPLIDVRDDLSVDDDGGVYVSDTGHNADSPVNTGLTVLEDVGYGMVPKAANEPDAGHSALPVDDDGEVIAPSIPLERDLQMPIDELLAKKLARNVPVRIVGPRGSGKNYLTKYICHKTNRGYRSLDVDKATMPQDLFGPISPNEDGKLEPKNADVKQGLLNGDVIVINEFPVMQSGAAMALHQLLNENKIVIKSHGQTIEPHPEARIVVTMNPPTREYRDSEPMNSATRGRFRGFWQGYPDTVDAEVETLDKQLNTPRPVVDEDTLEKIVEFAHRTRKDEFTNWPTLSTRNLTIVIEHIADGASPQAALKNVLRMVAEPNQRPEDAHEALSGIF